MLTPFQLISSSHNVGGTNIVTTGALGAGSIASGFGNIDNGASNITSGGLVKLDVDADADDVSGDSATGRLTLGASEDLNLYHGGTNSYIVNDTGDLIIKTGASDEDFIIQGNDGGSAITALTLDMSAAGAMFLTGGEIDLKNAGTVSNIKFYCESSNAHYAMLQSAAHSAYSGNVTLTLPASTDTLVGKATTDTLTNKTLTAPVITTGVFNTGAIFNEDSADVDFRVESNGATHALFVDGANGNVGMLGGNDSTIANGASWGTFLQLSDSESCAISLHDTGGKQYDIGTSADSLYLGYDATSGAHRLSVNDTQVKIHTGDLVFGTAGKGIVLGVTSNTDANTLDDYEEGTWTPTITFGGNSASVAYSTQTGHYTKIGRAVTLYAHVALSNKGSSTGHLNIAGLPFTPAGDYCPVSLRFQNLSFADMATAIVSSGATTVIFYETSNAGTETSLTESNAANNTRILFQATYRV